MQKIALFGGEGVERIDVHVVLFGTESRKCLSNRNDRAAFIGGEEKQSKSGLSNANSKLPI
jgi:hypothetical protein